MASKSMRSVDIITTSNPVAAATARATTIGELISTIPQSWRPTLAPYLQTTYRVASKLCTVSNTVAQYERHESTGSFPPFITNALKEPKVQFSKEFLGTAGGTSAGQNLRTAVEKARKDLLSKAIAYKKEELSTLQAAITFDTQEWKSLMRGAMERVAETMGCSIEWPEGKPPIWTGKAGLKELQEESTSLLTNGSTIHYRAVALARSLADKSLIEKTKNLSLKKSTDVEMRDADTEKTTREVVRDELDAKFAQFQQKIAGMIGRPEQPQVKGEDCQEDISEEEAGKTMTTSAFLSQCSRDFRSYDAETYPPVYASLSSSCRLKIAVSLMREWELGTWHTAEPGVFQHSSIDLPKDIGYMLAVNHKFILHQAPSLDDIDEAKFRLRRSVRNRWFFRDKTSRDFIPKFHVPNNRWQPPPASDWIEQGLHAAERVIDAHCARALTSSAVRPSSKPFKAWKTVQDYLAQHELLAKLTDKNLGLAVMPLHWYDSQILQMLSDVSTYEQVTSIPTSELVKEMISLLPSWRLPNQLDKYIRTPKKLVLPEFHCIPKPLLEHFPWVVASSKDVILQIEKVRTTNIKPVVIATGDVTSFYTNIPPKDCAKVIAGAWKLYMSSSTIPASAIRKMVDFVMVNNFFGYRGTTFRQKMGLAMGTSCAPVLANIYAAYFERKARIPLLEHFPWVVASSKDVILQIEKVRTTNIKPVVIATGDVTSFYTNIPPKDCAKVIAGAWKLYMSSSTIPASAIRKMVDFVMVNNFFGYRGTTFRQKMGLAMGTSCAPVLANIYAAYFERKARIVSQDGVLLYVRYIDDILCILQGTKEEQSDFVDRFRLGNLTVRWDSSSVRNEFLDIELLRIPYENHLRVCHTRLFRKPMNRFLYIPWSSAHPLHVKKGFVKAELTRFAILCSRYEFFAEARMEFYGNLRRRGYPVETLRQWFLQIQYDDRARILLPKQKIDNGAPLMLSGHYNPVWDYVDVKEVLDAARTLWTKEELPESLKQPLIRSLGRTTSLFDLLSTWNKTLLLLPSEEGPS
ncbi:hypothetical protein PspLS_11639 [Pyricularia sp. CBS 133598]|nr:hypothetical protein PspLS_11639 [Pyricularia sp. CBS 133598]